MTATIPLALALAACAPAPDAIDSGTAPDSATLDSDGDGYTDAEEREAGSDPEDGFSWPDAPGSWPDFSDLADAAISSPGWGMDDQIHDVQLVDQFGQAISLYQFYGLVVLLDLSAGWCPPCNTVAEDAEELYQRHKEDGFVLIHLMIGGWDTEEDDLVEVEFLREWSDLYGLSFPVTAEQAVEEGADSLVDSLRYAGTLTGGIPNFILLDRELRIDFTDAGLDHEAMLERVEAVVAAPATAG
jgi:thiol-disulfide isomerase/thioredoxin